MCGDVPSSSCTSAEWWTVVYTPNGWGNCLFTHEYAKTADEAGRNVKKEYEHRYRNHCAIDYVFPGRHESQGRWPC